MEWLFWYVEGDMKNVASIDVCRWFWCKGYLFRQRLSYENVKAYATMPIGIMGSKSLALLD